MRTSKGVLHYINLNIFLQIVTELNSIRFVAYRSATLLLSFLNFSPAFGGGQIVYSRGLFTYMPNPC